MKTKRVLIMGKSGHGKSTTANVIGGTNDFKEGWTAASQTQQYQLGTYLVGEDNITISDTVGFDDTSKSTKEVLKELANAVAQFPTGFEQLIFVSSGKWDPSQTEAFELVTNYLLDRSVLAFTTVVRTHFSRFRDPEACNEDIRQLEKLHPILQKCKIIHINNLPLEDDELLEAREESRTKLLVRLRVCQDQYIPPNIDGIQTKVSSYKTEEEKIVEQMEAQSRENERLEQERIRVEQERKAREAELARLAEIQKQKQLELERLKSPDVTCSRCTKLLLLPGQISFTGNHSLEIGTVSKITCAFCGCTTVITPAQLKKIGIVVG